MINVVIVNAYGRTNRGDCVLLDECISDVRKKYTNQLGELSVALFDAKGFSDVYADVPALERIGNAGHGLKGKLSKLWIWLIALAYCVVPCAKILRLLPGHQGITARKILDADVVISAPGGYVHDTNLAYLVALFHIFLGVRGRGRVILAPQSYGPLQSAFSRWLVKVVFNKTHVVCAREAYSCNFLKEIGVADNLVAITGDSAFWNDHVLMTDTSAFFTDLGLSPTESFVGMTVVGWTFPGVADVAAARKRYIAAMQQVIRGVYKSCGLRTVIFNQVQDDLPIAIEIAQGLEGVAFVDQLDKEPELLRALIARSQVFVGTRFHSCIFALMAGVPTNAVAYLPKTQYILHDLNLFDRHVDINDIDGQLLLSRVLADVDNVVGARLLTQAAVHDYREKMTRLLDVM